MNPFEMVVLIVAIVSVAGVLRAKYGVRRDHLGNEYSVRTPHTQANEALENARLQDEIKTLKERISVLERLATDDQRSIELDREIARLRDKTQ